MTHDDACTEVIALASNLKVLSSIQEHTHIFKLCSFHIFQYQGLDLNPYLFKLNHSRFFSLGFELGFLDKSKHGDH